MEFSISGVVAIWMCQLQNQMSNEKAEIHDCMQAGVGWEEKGFTVRSLRSKTKILWKEKKERDAAVSLHNPTDVSEGFPK